MASNVTAPVGISKNIKQIGRMDLPGGGSVVVENGYAYVGHMDPPHGTSIIDVKDPKHPKVVSHIEIAERLALAQGARQRRCHAGQLRALQSQARAAIGAQDFRHLE